MAVVVRAAQTSRCLVALNCHAILRQVTFVDATNPQNYAKAIRSATKLLYAESPCNLTLRMTDLHAVGEISKRFRRCRCVVVHLCSTFFRASTKFFVDCTFATPYNLQALAIPGWHCWILRLSCSLFASGSVLMRLHTRRPNSVNTRCNQISADLLAGTVSSNDRCAC